MNAQKMYTKQVGCYINSRNEVAPVFATVEEFKFNVTDIATLETDIVFVSAETEEKAIESAKRMYGNLETIVSLCK